MCGACMQEESVSTIWLCLPIIFFPVLTTFDNWEIVSSFCPSSERCEAKMDEKNTMSYITTCQALPVTQVWHCKKRPFTSYTDDHDTGTQLSLQRTRHVNTSALSCLSDTVWPIRQLPVNKIPVLYHPRLPLLELPFLFIC